MSQSLLGSRIGHLRFVEKLATGGMGEVYVGYDETLQRRVALKCIRQEFHLNEEAKARFLREARVLSQLGHPNICQIYDYVEGEASDFIVMELVAGQSLGRLIKKGLDAKAKMRIALEIAGVLVAAHEKGVVHRDLKPDNVMVTEEGRVKVLDFGLSRQLGDEATVGIEGAPAEMRAEKAGHDPGDDGTFGIEDHGEPGRSSTDSGRLTTAGSIMGTVGYMSPEQARGEIATSASDMYSFGLLLQEVFTGRPPVEPGLDFAARVEKAKKGETLPVNGVDADLKALIERLKSLAPGARPSAEDTLQRLVWIREKPARRRKKLALGGAAAALVLFSVAMAVQSVRATRAEKRAKQEAETAKQVSDFLINIFQVSDPGEARGRTITAREILDNGSKRIKTELGNQPLVQARLMNTMGEVYYNLGLYEEAEPILKSSLALRERNLSSNDPQLADSLDRLANLYSDQGRYADAESLYKRALSIRETVLGSDHPDVADSLNNLATLYWQQGKYADAEALYKRALAICEKDDPDLPANLINNLANLYSDQGKYAEAEPLFKQALAIRQKSLGADHPDVAIDLNNLAVCYVNRGKYAEAGPLLLQCLALWEKSLGSDHPNVAAGLNNLASVYRIEGKYAEAEPLFKRALAIREKALGPDHPDVAISLNNLANLYFLQGKYSEAEPLTERALAVREKALGPDHPDVAATLFSMALLDYALEKYSQAQPLFSRCLSIRESVLGARSQKCAETLRAFASCELKEQKIRDALKHSADCLDIGRELAAKSPEDKSARFLLGAALLLMGQIESARNNHEGGQSMWKEALSILQPIAKEAEAVSDQDTYAQVLLCLGRLEEARPVVKKLWDCGYKNPDLLALCREKGVAMD